MTALTPGSSDARRPLPRNASQRHDGGHGHLSVCRKVDTKSSPGGLLPVPAHQQPVGRLLARQRIGDVVAPLPRDVQERAAYPLLPEAELLDDASAGRVLRADVHLDAVQADPPEAVVGDQGDRRRHHAVTGDPLVDPVTEMRGVQRAAYDATDVELPHERAVVEHTEGQPPTEPGILAEPPGHRDERRRRRRHVGGCARRRRLPLAKPLLVTPSNLDPGRAVAQPRRLHVHRTVVELSRPAGGAVARPARSRPRQWSPPRSWVIACPMPGSRTLTPSRTPLTEPGRFTT